MASCSWRKEEASLSLRTFYCCILLIMFRDLQLWNWVVLRGETFYSGHWKGIMYKLVNLGEMFEFASLLQAEFWSNFNCLLLQHILFLNI